LGTNPTLLRSTLCLARPALAERIKSPLQCGRSAFPRLGFTPFAHKLVNCRHALFSPYSLFVTLWSYRLTPRSIVEIYQSTYKLNNHEPYRFFTFTQYRRQPAPNGGHRNTILRWPPLEFFAIRLETSTYVSYIFYPDIRKWSVPQTVTKSTNPVVFNLHFYHWPRHAFLGVNGFRFHPLIRVGLRPLRIGQRRTRL